MVWRVVWVVGGARMCGWDGVWCGYVLACGVEWVYVVLCGQVWVYLHVRCGRCSGAVLWEMMCVVGLSGVCA